MLKDQLARSAAAIIIQAQFRGWVVKRKYIAVVFARLTIQSISSGGTRNIDGLPSIFDLSLQVNIHYFSENHY